MPSVLVVEDDALLRQAMAMLLELEGYRVVTAQHGLEALQRLESDGRPCIIILDLMMPVMDGIAFRAEQLKRKALSEIPVVIVTGHEDAETIAHSTGAHALMRKPFRPEDVVQIVREHCR